MGPGMRLALLFLLLSIAALAVLLALVDTVR
jgi:hypothetical protein